jgi:hypothetical protein
MAAYKPERSRGHDDSPSRGDRSRKAASKHPTGRAHVGSVAASKSHTRKNPADDDSSPERLTSKVTNAPSEARKSSTNEQLALGAHHRGPDRVQASPVPVGSSVGAKRARPTYWHLVRNDMGKYPFVTAANRILRDTAPFYAKSTQKERGCKFRRIYRILSDLKENGVVLSPFEKGQELRERISSTNPKKMTERDIELFIAWCNEKLDASTSKKYIRFLEEVLQSVGNNAVKLVKMKRRDIMPKATLKSIKTISPIDLERPFRTP